MVLIAEDDPIVRTVINKTLGGIIKNAFVTDGAELITKYKEILPDILILDIHLPNKSGLELIAEIKKIDPAAYIVMLSADSSRENVINAMSKGAVNFLTKPFTRHKLLEVINNCPTISKQYE
ncbi:MAG: hypothetical protein BGO27_00010 [Alphaproteobacteria bacterium 33-17]|nr:MAG: hypothetical protein BGO27_00010 [Alphaproteobacteria bacterium 33-17]